jgi:hypothetical protein
MILVKLSVKLARKVSLKSEANNDDQQFFQNCGVYPQTHILQEFENKIDCLGHDLAHPWRSPTPTTSESRHICIDEAKLFSLI